MSELAPSAIDAVVWSLVVGIAQGLLIVLSHMCLLLQLVFAMSKCTIVAKGTVLASRPKLAQLCFHFHFVILLCLVLFFFVYFIHGFVSLVHVVMRVMHAWCPSRYKHPGLGLHGEGIGWHGKWVDFLFVGRIKR